MGVAANEILLAALAGALAGEACPRTDPEVGDRFASRNAS